MKLKQLKKEIQKYQYFEDTSVIDVTLASAIANRLDFKNTKPIWLVVIGASSGGKTQILRPLQMTDPEFIHSVDDLTENTFLSAKGGDKDKGKQSTSLLHRIGKKGIIVMSDLTILFSKNNEAKNAILSQFRGIYDGELTKMSGNSSENNTWKGRLGIIAGSTPSIYRHFEEVSDMGERFVFYRMKDFDPRQATEIALSRGQEPDKVLADLYRDYMMAVCKNTDTSKLELTKEDRTRIIDVAILAEKIRTSVKMDWKAEKITHLPVSAYPMRISLQMSAIALGLMAINFHETGDEKLTQKDYESLDWLAYSFANEEKRACLNILASQPYGYYLRTSVIADKVGLDTSIIKNILQNLSAVGLLDRTGSDYGLSWSIKQESDLEILRRISKVEENKIENRELTNEEDVEYDNSEEEFENMSF